MFLTAFLIQNIQEIDKIKGRKKRLKIKEAGGK